MPNAPRACTGSTSSRPGGHTAHRGWANLILDRTRGLIIHGPAHRGANGAAMPTDEDDQHDHFFLNHLGGDLAAEAREASAAAV